MIELDQALKGIMRPGHGATTTVTPVSGETQVPFDDQPRTAPAASRIVAEGATAASAEIPEVLQRLTVSKIPASSGHESASGSGPIAPRSTSGHFGERKCRSRRWALWHSCS